MKDWTYGEVATISLKVQEQNSPIIISHLIYLILVLVLKKDTKILKHLVICVCIRMVICIIILILVLGRMELSLLMNFIIIYRGR